MTSQNIKDSKFYASQVAEGITDHKITGFYKDGDKSRFKVETVAVQDGPLRSYEETYVFRDNRLLPASRILKITSYPALRPGAFMMSGGQKGYGSFSIAKLNRGVKLDVLAEAVKKMVSDEERLFFQSDWFDYTLSEEDYFGPKDKRAEKRALTPDEALALVKKVPLREWKRSPIDGWVATLTYDNSGNRFGPAIIFEKQLQGWQGVDDQNTLRIYPQGLEERCHEFYQEGPGELNDLFYQLDGKVTDFSLQHSRQTLVNLGLPKERAAVLVSKK